MKKLVNIFSLCIILSSFLFTPLTAIAQTSISKSESIVNSSKQTKATENANATTPTQPRESSLTTAKDWGYNFITNTELEDENGDAQTEFGIYENMKAHWDFSIPAGTDIQSGDTMTVNVPDVLTLQSNVSFDITDASGNVIGHAVANHSTGKVVVTFTDYAAESAKNGINGNFDISVNWDTTQVNQDTVVPIDWGTGGTTNVIIDPSDGPDADETLYKWGWYDDDDPSIIHWRVRVNYSNEDIKNAVYKDLVGDNQELISGTIQAYKVKFHEDGNTFDIISNYPSSAITENETTEFTVNLGDITGPVIIDYETKITDGGNAGTYENQGTLSGDNIETETVDVESPTNGGGGSADTKTSISGTKTWIDDDNASGVRPKSVTIDLYQNGTKIDSKVVTATDNWTYNFGELDKVDSNGDEYIYTIQEEPVEGYTPTVDGYNVTNTRINTSLSLTAKKVLEGKELISGAYQFELKDSDGQVIQTKSNDGTGAINFDSIKYDKAGTYTYTITEVKGNETGITYDTHEIKVKVTVVEKDGQLIATATYDGDQTFTNKYSPSSSEVSLTAKKVLEGKDLVSGAYQFELKDSDGQIIQTKSNDGTGAINFDSIKYDKAGTYTYTITEVKGNETGITYDTHEIKVKVTVVEKDGQLIATATYDGDQTFTNKYTPTTPNDVLPSTGETSTEAFEFMGSILMLAVTVWVYLIQKKKQI